MFQARLGLWLRIILGSIVGAIPAIAILLTGETFIQNRLGVDLNPSVYFRPEVYGFLARMPWIILGGVVIGVAAGLSATGLKKWVLPAVGGTVAGGMLITAVYMAYHEFSAVQGGSLFPEYVLLALENFVFYLFIAAIPMFLVTLGVTAITTHDFSSRSGKEFMPQELLHEIEQRETAHVDKQ